MKYFISLVLLFITSLSFAQTAKPTGSIMPKEVVGQLIDAMKKNDAETIRSLFSKDAKQAYGTSSPKSGDSFRAWLESDIISVKGQVDNPSLSVDDNKVTVKGTYKNNNGYTSPANFLFTVDKGQITSWTMRY